MNIIRNLVLILGLGMFFSSAIGAGVSMKKPPYRDGEKIDVLFLNGEFNQQGMVAAIANEWTYYATVFFDFHFSEDLTQGEVEALEKNPKTLIVKFNNKNKNHWTNEATNFYGGRNYSIALDGIDTRTILHEFGHALGLHHEHQHPESEVNLDPQKKISVCRGFGLSLEHCDRNLFQKLSKSDTRLTPYDRHSIMHYGISSPATQDGQEFNSNTYISYGDALTISKMYPSRLKNTKRSEIKKLVEKRQRLFYDLSMFGGDEDEDEEGSYAWLHDYTGDKKIEVIRDKKADFGQNEDYLVEDYIVLITNHDDGSTDVTSISRRDNPDGYLGSTRNAIKIDWQTNWPVTRYKESYFIKDYKLRSKSNSGTESIAWNGIMVFYNENPIHIMNFDGLDKRKLLVDKSFIFSLKAKGDSVNIYGWDELETYEHIQAFIPYKYIKGLAIYRLEAQITVVLLRDGESLYKIYFDKKKTCTRLKVEPEKKMKLKDCMKMYENQLKFYTSNFKG